jgi:hypothetical protein
VLAGYAFTSFSLQPSFREMYVESLGVVMMLKVGLVYSMF